MESSLRYIGSSSLHQRIAIKIGTLEGENVGYSYEKLIEQPLLKFSGMYTEKTPPLKVKLQIFENGEPVGLSVCTSHKHFSTRWRLVTILLITTDRRKRHTGLTNDCLIAYSWNEWVTLPLRFTDISRSAVLGLTIYDCAGGREQLTVVGGTSITFFSTNGLFRQGLYDLKVWPQMEPDGTSNSTTPGKCSSAGVNQMQRLSKLAKKHRNGQMEKIDWLDRLTFRELEVINEMEKRNSQFLYLMVEFPQVYIDEKLYSVIHLEKNSNSMLTFIQKPKIVVVPDCEIHQENLVERKHHRLSRSARSGTSDRDVKPNAVARDTLNAIVYRYSSTYPLSSEEQDIIWKYRFYLSSHKKALTKFLKCVNWETATEVRQALALLETWSPMDVEDALELLTSTFRHPVVRWYAITRLNEASDEYLLLYLLQLVQALKYEPYDESSVRKIVILPIGHQAKDEKFSNHTKNLQKPSLMICKWIMQVCLLHVARCIYTVVQLSTNVEKTGIADTNVEGEIKNRYHGNTVNSLANFLVERACKNPTLANYLYWYLSIECEDERSSKKDLKISE
uniref:Phosphatidylinositol 3-kinase catalytic subunit type 3 n=1 Tax=Anopheles maculatus TaxID=74869 RepID=A0A182S9W3_9DIPT